MLKNVVFVQLGAFSCGHLTEMICQEYIVYSKQIIMLASVSSNAPYISIPVFYLSFSRHILNHHYFGDHSGRRDDTVNPTGSIAGNENGLYSSREGDGGESGGREILRGSDRRRAFEEQRRRMMSYARADAAERRIRRQLGDEGGEEADRCATGAAADSPTHLEGSLRNSLPSGGALRPDRYTQPAPVTVQQPLQPLPSSPISQSDRTEVARLSPHLAASVRVLRRKMWLLLRSANSALSQLGPTPHSPAAAGNIVGVGAGAGVAPEDQTGGPSFNQSYHIVSVIKWALRLHLAIFYLEGKYPTWSHRLAGVRMTSSPSPGAVSCGKIVSDRPAYRVLGLILVAQAASVLLGTAARMGIDAVHQWRIRWEASAAEETRTIQRNEHETPESSDRVRQSCAESLERRVPSISSVGNSAPQRQRIRQSIDRLSSVPTCGICIRPRIHPAVSRNCGHVLCWECIQRWIGTVKEECPVCRAPAGPGDIIPLYGY
mmetsp:Transcript_62223/g.184036  ORF Transcript_62223/g.184036 Transcript_62223/m.184036 type:complete len:489 (-) Transcript_62223:31-1497(-)